MYSRTEKDKYNVDNVSQVSFFFPQAIIINQERVMARMNPVVLGWEWRYEY